MKSMAALVLIALAIVVAIAIFFFVVNKDVASSDIYSGGNSGGIQGSLYPAPGSQGVEEMIVNQSGPENQVFYVEITSSGFSPQSLQISQGDTVTWINKGSSSAWPASNNHPTHTLYPGFDAKKGLQNGESYSFTFDKVGTWGYHDHLSVSQKGTIVVK